jgi:hypothetical protein
MSAQPVARTAMSAQPVGSAALVTPAQLHLLAEDDLSGAFGTTTRVSVSLGDTRRFRQET